MGSAPQTPDEFRRTIPQVPRMSVVPHRPSVRGRTWRRRRCQRHRLARRRPRGGRGGLRWRRRDLLQDVLIGGLQLGDLARDLPLVGDDLRAKLVDALTDRGQTERRRFEQLRIRSEEHTSELQSRPHLVCRLLLEKKKKNLKKNILKKKKKKKKTT